MAEISVIIPAKNEAGCLARCIESLLSGAGALLQDIIVVDCASTDTTVAEAMRFPVNLLQLEPDWKHSPAAARHIGTLHARADYLFFIDADMRYQRGFLEQALHFLRADPRCAGVSGICREVHIRDGRETAVIEDLYKAGPGVRDARFIGGAALYRAQPLREAGGFNPYLRAAEEWDLARRLRSTGLKLSFIPVPMAVHFTAPIADWSEFRRKKNAGFFFGIGQSLRLCSTLPFLLEGLRYHREFTCCALALAASAAGLGIVSRFGIAASLSAAAAPFVIALTASWLRKKSIPRGSAAFLKWLIISAEIMHGMLAPVDEPARYPHTPRVLKGHPYVC